MQTPSQRCHAGQPGNEESSLAGETLATSTPSAIELLSRSNDVPIGAKRRLKCRPKLFIDFDVNAEALPPDIAAMLKDRNESSDASRF